MTGQGTVLPGRVRAGVWSPAAAAHPGQDPEDDAANAVLAGLDPARREVVAGLLEQVYAGAVHDVLRVLHEHEVPPFDDGDEGTPFHDFMGRLLDAERS
ncbi:hypothetical protein CCO04_09935 [Pimelobacter sp. 30-1]|nr:hypothetical protein [Pimelobacter sp. 30-1]